MKLKLITILWMLAGVVMMAPANVYAYNYGDFRSETLVTKAWNAMSQDDIEAVLAYTNKVVELYGDQAKKMQQSLDQYPEGSNEEVFGYWALNDVATALFVQAEAYRKAGMEDEAKTVYKTVANEYKFGQSWDPKGWFWKPAEAAKEKLTMLESGSNLDFGDYTSSFLTTQAWKALENGNTEEVIAYTDKVLELYADKAKDMQSSLSEYPWESKEKIFSFWALNDVGTALYIKGEALKREGQTQAAQEAYKKLVDEFYYAQCWDPNGWFWKPAEAAQQAIDEVSNA